PDLVGGEAPEHHVELREPEDEGVARVDERYLHLVGELVGQPGRQLEATEPGAQDHDMHTHSHRLAPLELVDGSLSRGDRRAKPRRGGFATPYVRSSDALTMLVIVGSVERTELSSWSTMTEHPTRDAPHCSTR